jgi:hypothetical protein
MKPIQKEVFDDRGNLKVIEVTDAETGEHVADFLWDRRDEQTPENRTKFREWVQMWIDQRLGRKHHANKTRTNT